MGYFGVLERGVQDRLRVRPASHRSAALTVHTLSLSIAAVERDTGLSKDTLRIWERRYGFPDPGRDPAGERAYPLVQVERLRVIKRLLDAGHRPGRVVPLPIEQLKTLAEQITEQPARQGEVVLDGAELRELLEVACGHDVMRLRNRLLRLLAHVGAQRFVTEVLGPLNQAISEACLRGQIEVYQQHAYAENVQVVLHKAVASIPTPDDPRAPRVLLCTFSGEPQPLPLLMMEVVLTLAGCRCISLGVQTPLWDIMMAGKAYAIDAVALGFSHHLGPTQVMDGLTELRAKLPPHMAVWVAGASPVVQRRPLAGVRMLASYDGLADALREMQASATQRAAEANGPSEASPGGNRG